MARYKKGYPYRCSDRKCRTRRTFLLRVEDYSRNFKFLTCQCGGTKWGVDQYRVNKEADAFNCRCDGLRHIHRIRSKWCNHYKGEYTERDYEERYGYSTVQNTENH